jgi:hypothetical protein
VVHQVRHHVHGLTAHEGATLGIEGVNDPLHRAPFERVVEALGDRLTDVEEDEGEEEGGLEVEWDAMGRGFPEGGEIEHPCGDQEGSFTAPAPPIQLTDVARGELDRVQDVREVPRPLPPP